MLSIEEKILTLNSLRLLPVAALRFTLYAFYWCPLFSVLWTDIGSVCELIFIHCVGTKNVFIMLLSVHTCSHRAQC